MKSLLISMPWADYEYPSLQIGVLAAWARREGFKVDTRHLHLETASMFGFADYDKIIHSEYPVKEPFFGLLLYPHKRSQTIKYLNKYLAEPERYLNRISRIMKRVYKSVNWEHYKLVGFTINYEQVFASLLFSKWLKRDYPHIKIVFGGPCVLRLLGANLLECFPQVDWCVDGEGEIAFVELLKYLKKGGGKGCESTPGLIYRNENGIKINSIKQIANLNDLPHPDIDSYFHYLNNNRPNNAFHVCIPIEWSRGCPNRCAFCNTCVHWPGFRNRSPKLVREQLKKHLYKYRSPHFMFTDNIIPPRYINRVFGPIAKMKCDFDIFHEIRANSKKSDLVVMHKAGVRWVQIGIEALSTKLLRKMSKGMRFIDNLQAMKYCEELRIDNTYNLILKFPTETQRDIDETVKNMDYAYGYRPPFALLDFQLLGGSKVYDNPNKYGISNIAYNYRPYSKLRKYLRLEHSFLFKNNYVSRKPGRNYRRLKRKYKQWKKAYDDAVLDGRISLGYYDHQKFLYIEDYRFGSKMITLEGLARDLYLFCDSIRSWEDIKNRYSKQSYEDIEKILHSLVKSKVMYCEDNQYVSLAININKAR